MTDFDILARIRKLEAENDGLKHRIAELERREQRQATSVAFHDATAYRRLRDSGRVPIWPSAEDENA